MLQGHIWLLYQLHLPYYAFKIIPCVYFFIALFFLGFFTWGRSTKTYGGLLFTLFLMFCFAYQFQVERLSKALYQESVDLAFFFVLLWCGAIELARDPTGTTRDGSTPPVSRARLGASDLNGCRSGPMPLGANKWLLLIAAGAMLTREDFWIYLFTISLLNYKQILSVREYRRGFLALWSVIALWMLSTPFIYRRYVGRYPSFPVEWPLGINKEGNHAVSSLSMSLSRLVTSLRFSRATYLVAGLIIVWIIGRVSGGAQVPRVKPRDIFESRFRSFSFLSLSIIYLLILLFDPWEATSFSGRLAIPLIAQCFVWTSLLFSRTNSYSVPAKVLARGVLAAALILSLNPDVRAWIPKPGNPDEKSIAEISGLVKAAGRNGKANACILVADYWEALEGFAAPTLYATWSPTPNEDIASGACDVVIRPQNSNAIVPGGEYAKYGDYEFTLDEYGTRSYSVFQRVGRLQRSPKSER